MTITNPSNNILEYEFAQSKALLRARLDRDLLDKWVAERGEQDWPAALLDHLRTRTSPHLLFSPDNVRHILELCREHDPSEFAWEQRIADEAVAGRVYAASNPYCDRFVDLDRDTFDFSQFDHWDKEALHGLNRQRWYVSLARHYWIDQDPDYYDTLMREWDFFVEVAPPIDEALLAQIRGIGSSPWGPPPPHYELDVFIRLNHWWWAYWLMLHAEHMTPERNAVLLARCLRLFDRVAARGVRVQEHNFTSMQMEALYLWSTTLPEATGMNIWRHAARNNLEASLNRAVAEDGSHWEQSLGYHSGCIRWYGSSALLARRNGHAFADGYVERLRHMGDFLDALVTPDGNMPLLSDTDRTSGWKSGLALVKCLFPDKPFRHEVQPTYGSLWISDGFEWDAEASPVDAPSVSIFPQAGLGVVRPQDRDTGDMLILDNGPNAAGHAHMDNLTIHYEALGKPVIVDPGRWVYSPGPDRNWVTHAHSHNTLFIEVEPLAPGQMLEQSLIQRIDSTNDPRIGPISHQQYGGIVQMKTSLKAYADDLDAGVWRTLVFPIADQQSPWLAVVDRFESATPHTWTNAWLLPAEQPVQAEGTGYVASLASGLTVKFAVDSGQEQSLRDDTMFWCPNYAEKSPARWLRFSSHTATSGQRAFIFAPTTGDGPMPGVELDGTTLRLTINDTVITQEI